MKILGFYLGRHDSNLSFYDEGLKYIKSERQFQVKHHHASLQWVEQICLDNNFVPDVIAFSDGNRNELGSCKGDQLYKEIPGFKLLGKNIPTFCLDHHYAHMLSAWPMQNTSEIEYGISIDGRGDNGRRVTIIRDPGKENPNIVYQSTEHAYCSFLNQIGRRMGLKGKHIDHAGKIMGAQAYGKIDDQFISHYAKSNIYTDLSQLFKSIEWNGVVPDKKQSFYDFEIPSFRDWLSTVHALMESLIIRLFKEHIPPNSKTVYAGGAAQNTVINNKLFKLYHNLIIPPHAYDGGLSLGCLEFVRLKFGMDKLNVSGFPFWQSDEHGGIAELPTIQKVAQLIDQGKIVGWFQGNGAIGPRALGHRSILLDPRRIDGKDLINKRIKRREHWRPYAASLLQSYSEEVFNEQLISPYMLRALEIKRVVQASIPAVVHEDGTCRPQTVNEQDHELNSYTRLLSCFSELSGMPILLNTSLNINGKPIVATKEQALQLFKSSALDALCIGNELFLK